MPKTAAPRFVLPYGDHPMFKLALDDPDALIVERGSFNGAEWYIIEIPLYGYVANFYADPYDGDAKSVDGYFDSFEEARQYLGDMLDA